MLSHSLLVNCIIYLFIQVLTYLGRPLDVLCLLLVIHGLVPGDFPRLLKFGYGREYRQLLWVRNGLRHAFASIDIE